MNLYSIRSFDGDILALHATLAEAHAYAKRLAGRQSLSIALHDLATDKATVLQLARAAYLLPSGVLPPMLTLREWVLTPRGGLRETEPMDA
jgi:hypothetical protein